MISKAYCQTQATYNAWMNSKVYGACDGLSDATRKRDLKAFFRSIHGTLDHVLAVDEMFLSHFLAGTEFFFPELNLVADYGDLRRKREAADLALLSWSRGVTSAWLAKPATYSDHGGTTREVSQGFWVTHMFNHQIHHRGQTTTLLSQLGIDIGSTDLHMTVPEISWPEF